jgi:hypothetical protein
MRLKKTFFWMLAGCVLFVSISFSQYTQSSLYSKLKSLPDIVEVKPLVPDSMYSEYYDIQIRQPLDHANPAKGSFIQHFYLSHIDESRPMLMETEGYTSYAESKPREISRLFKTNQIEIEHRFFGKSRPDSLIWEYLTLKQAADDLHHIASVLKKIYNGKWISSGISKGGQTTLSYRYYYPDDVTCSIAYVAPVPLTEEDPRIYTHLESVGTDECRKKIKEFQIDLLKRENEFLPLLKELGDKKKWTFPIGLETAFEFIVLEYSFSFWQWGASTCRDIPLPGTKTEEEFGHLQKVVSMSDYASPGISYYAPSMYQNYAQIGYYAYDITEFRPYLKTVTDATNLKLAPQNVRIEYDCITMDKINRWLQREANNIIYLYGELDPWSGCAIHLIGNNNCLKYINKGGNHTTRIKNLSTEQKETIYTTLEKWLNMKIEKKL